MSTVAIRTASVASLITRATGNAPASASTSAAKVIALDSYAASKVQARSGDVALAPPSAPVVAMSAKVVAGAEAFASNVDAAFDIDNMAPNNMLTAFLKLNITDPNNSVETHNALCEAASNLRQMAIATAKEQNNRATELQQEAETYANQVGVLTDIVGAVAMATNVGALVTGLATTVIAGELSSGLAAAADTATGAGKLANAVENYVVRSYQLAAQEAELMSDRSELTATEEQQRVEDESEIINTVMESKNAMVDAVLNMMEAARVSKQALLEAAIAR